MGLYFRNFSLLYETLSRNSRRWVKKVLKSTAVSIYLVNPGSLSLKEKHNNGKKQRNVCELTFFSLILVLADKAMLKCVLKCSTTAGRTFDNRGHRHCAYCFQICERKNAMTVHLNTHSKVNVSITFWAIFWFFSFPFLLIILSPLLYITLRGTILVYLDVPLSSPSNIQCNSI